MQYIVSPYLRLYNDRKDTLYNFLTNKLQSINDSEMEILNYCTRPQSIEFLIKKYGQRVIYHLIDKMQILEYKSMWHQHQIIHLEIETSTVCNWKCEYCPVSSSPRAPRFIDKKLFTFILNRALEYKYIKWISLHSFNEPTIDPNLYFYIDEMKKRNLKWGLFTNGSGLNEEKVKYMKEYSTIHQVIINIPSINKSTYERMTGAKTYEQSMHAIRLLREYGIDVQIIVMGRGEEQAYEVKNIRKAFPDIQIISFESYDRIGSLKNKYQQNINLSEKYLTGCYMLTERASISIDGDILLCCNDYARSITFGNLKNESLQLLLSSKEISDMRKLVWGGASPPEDFYCRKCGMMRSSMYEDFYKRLDI